MACVAQIGGGVNMYDDSEKRYKDDAAFHAAVNILQAMAAEHGFTPGEIAFYAALRLELYTNRGSFR